MRAAPSVHDAREKAAVVLQRAHVCFPAHSVLVMNNADPRLTPPVPRPARSGFITALGWIVIVISALTIPISAISLAMILTHSYGMSSATALGFVMVVLGPPVSLVAGVGLLRRKRWGWAVILAVLTLIVISSAGDIVQAPLRPVTYTVPSGVPTTVLPRDFTFYCYLLPFVVVCAGVIVKLLTKKVRAEFAAASPSGLITGTRQFPSPASSTGGARRQSESADRERGWRVGHRGRDGMFYEEWREGAWQQIEVQGEMLTGRAHHVIYFDSPERWQRHPAWARDRRDAIITRIKSEFRVPDYEYQGDGAPPPPQPITTRIASRATARSAPLMRAAAPIIPQKEPASRWLALWVMVILFLGLACGMCWLVNDGVRKGETVLPMKRATLRRGVSRENDPATFWCSIGLYALVGVGASGFALWLTREALRSGKK